jgi:hypothetical protein
MRESALAILSNPDFEFWYSTLLKLELTLQPAHQRRKLELAFYDAYFKSADCFGDLNRIFEIGAPEAVKHGIPVLDVLHIAAASLSKCKTLFTTEGPTKPLFRTNLVRVVSILSPTTKRPS